MALTVLKKGVGEPISLGARIALHYRISESIEALQRGDVMESSYVGNSPLAVTLGEGELIDEVESALLGQALLASLVVDVSVRLHCPRKYDPYLKDRNITVELYIADILPPANDYHQTFYACTASLDVEIDPHLEFISELRLSLKNARRQRNGYVLNIDRKLASRLMEILRDSSYPMQRFVAPKEIFHEGTQSELLITSASFEFLTLYCGGSVGDDL